MTTENHERNYRILNTLNSVSNDLNSIRDDIKVFINARYTKDNLKHLTASEIKLCIDDFIQNTIRTLLPDKTYSFNEWVNTRYKDLSIESVNSLWAYFIYYKTINDNLSIMVTDYLSKKFKIVKQLPKYTYNSFNGFYYILKDNVEIRKVINNVECSLLFDTVEQAKIYIEHLKAQDEKENKETQT